METIRLFTPDQIKSIEQRAINEFFIPELILMENAAMALYSRIEDKFKGFKVVVLVGPGNNGGDGMALSRILCSKGWNVKNYFLKKPNYKGASQTNYLACKHVPAVEKLNLDNKTLVIDALFGTGLSREFDSKTLDIISEVNESNAKVVSADIPSGISALSGEIVGGKAIKADYTITFCSNKLGLYIFPGHSHCGEIVVDTISIPKDIIETTNTNLFLNTSVKYPIRLNPCHKTSYGKTLVLSGSKNYYGAPLFACKASLLSGSGYTTLCTSKEVIKSVSKSLPEVVYRDCMEYISEVQGAGFIVYGSGLGDDVDKGVLKNILKEAKGSVLIDGDGFKLMDGLLEELRGFPGDLILTPHPKEAASLINKTTDEINKNRVSNAIEISKKYNATVVLKGTHSVIAFETGEVFINTIGSTALSTAGSGDILCGIIAGLSGFMGVFDAVRSGVYLHGKMGKLAFNEIGSVGITATDLLKFIPGAMVPS